MNPLSYLRSLAARIAHRDQIADDMEEELCSHIDLRAADLERSGLGRTEAHRRARIEFGARERYKEESYEAMGVGFLEKLVEDLRIALRILRKSPGFAAAAVFTLALAIGANSVVFGLMDKLILHPLNVPHAETLYGTEYGDGAGWQSYPNYIDLRDRNHSFESLAAFRFAFVGLDTGKDPAPASGFATTGNYFDVLGVRPYLGRFFGVSDERGPNSAPYLVLSYSFWHTRFQDDPGVLGRVVRINKHPFTVIGVAPEGFQGSLAFISPDFFLPIFDQPQIEGENLLEARGSSNGVFEAFGHLKPGVTPQQAIADMNTIGAALEKAYPKEFVNAFPGHKGSVLTRLGLTSFGGGVRAFVAGLMVLSGLILLAACANLGSLFAAHASDRSREVALRLALGSTRKRILRQLLTQAMLISFAGGALGVLGSVALLRQLSNFSPFGGVPLRVPLNPGPAIYFVALALALVSGFLFGIVPVRQVLRANPYEIVKAGLSGAVVSSRFGRISVRDVLLVLQISICGVLITSSMVAVRGLARSLHASYGFDPQNTMLVSTNLAMAGYAGDAIPAMQRRLLETVQAIPGVESAALVNNYPPLVYLAGNRVNVFKDETRDLKQSNVAAMPYRYQVSPDYFRAASTTLLAGRDFTWSDDKTAPPVAIVNREFARRMLGSINEAVGRYYRLQDGTRIQIVGVAEDGKYQILTEDQQPAMFQPFRQSQPESLSHLIVRSHRDPQELAGIMRRKLHDLDSGLPVETQSWNDMMSVVLFPARFATFALGVLGALGAILSITGIFGMAAYSVSKRIRELGIRIALGAQRSQVLRTALGRAVKLLACGSVAGLLLGLLATRVLSFIVYQATPRDPIVLAGVVVAMALLGLLATWIPAQRALSVNPLILLREE